MKLPTLTLVLIAAKLLHLNGTLCKLHQRTNSRAKHIPTHLPEATSRKPNSRFMKEMVKADPVNCLPELVCGISAATPSGVTNLFNDYTFLAKELLSEEVDNSRDENFRKYRQTAQNSIIKDGFQIKNFHKRMGNAKNSTANSATSREWQAHAKDLIKGKNAMWDYMHRKRRQLLQTKGLRNKIALAAEVGSRFHKNGRKCRAIFDKCPVVMSSLEEFIEDLRKEMSEAEASIKLSPQESNEPLSSHLKLILNINTEPLKPTAASISSAVKQAANTHRETDSDSTTDINSDSVATIVPSLTAVTTEGSELDFTTEMPPTQKPTDAWTSTQPKEKTHNHLKDSIVIHPPLYNQGQTKSSKNPAKYKNKNDETRLGIMRSPTRPQRKKIPEKKETTTLLNLLLKEMQSSDSSESSSPEDSTMDDINESPMRQQHNKPWQYYSRPVMTNNSIRMSDREKNQSWLSKIFSMVFSWLQPFLKSSRYDSRKDLGVFNNLLRKKSRRNHFRFELQSNSVSYLLSLLFRIPKYLLAHTIISMFF